MAPNELNKSLTFSLIDHLENTSFYKKRIGVFLREKKECRQFFSFYFSRRGSNTYQLTANLFFSFPDVDRLTSIFLGKEYDKTLCTGAEPLYTNVPNGSFLKYVYSADEPFEQFTKILAEDFCNYALPFYEKFDTVNKLEQYFDRHLYGDMDREFRIVQTDRQGQGSGCLIAAVYCVLHEWEKLKVFIDKTNLLQEEHKVRVYEYIGNA